MEKKITRLEVALRAGVSESTVSRALNDSPLITPEVKLRVRNAAAQLGYIPNRQAELLARKRTFRLGLVVRTYDRFPPFTRSYFPRLLDGVVLCAEELGYSVTIVLDRKHGKFRDMVRFVQSKEVDGLLFAVTPTEDPRFDRLQENQIPFVLINSHREGSSSVDGDPRRGMRMSFEHACTFGHTRIGYVTGDLAYWNGVERLSVFRELCEEFPVEPRIFIGDFSKSCGYRAAREFFGSDDPPTIIMTASDREALGVLDYCREQGIRVPEDASIIGYDNLGPSSDITPGLTTVDNPVSQTGRESVRLLVDTIEKRVHRPVRTTLETGFIVRESTGPVRSNPLPVFRTGIPS